MRQLRDCRRRLRRWGSDQRFSNQNQLPNPEAKLGLPLVTLVPPEPIPASPESWRICGGACALREQASKSVVVQRVSLRGISRQLIRHPPLIRQGPVNEPSLAAGWPAMVAPRPATAGTGHRPSACCVEAAVLVVLTIHSMMLVGRTVRRPPISVKEPAQQPSIALWRPARLPTA